MVTARDPQFGGALSLALAAASNAALFSCLTLPSSFGGRLVFFEDSATCCLV